jgi:hypothetical protein
VPLAEADTSLAVLAPDEDVDVFHALAVRFDRVRFLTSWTLDHLRGDLAARLGRLVEAREWYERGLRWSLSEGVLSEALRCRHGLARLGLVADGPEGSIGGHVRYWSEVAAGERPDPYAGASGGPDGAR